VSEAPRPTTFRVPVSPVDIIRRYWLSLLVLLVVVVFGVQFFRTSFYDKGYAPEQPIAFSHARHAGLNGIDCKYCHFNAERGKHAGVPPMSVCMGCHSTLAGVMANSPEIQKLNEIADKGSYTENGVVHEGGVVHWKRVHNLPDFVYFPHKWHVAAGVACQTCHGPVEEMAVVRQHATLSMGWCLECHRRGNYIGGRSHDPEKPESFSVGTANYDVQRARIAYDDVVRFTERTTAASAGGAHGDTAHGETHTQVSTDDDHSATAPSQQYTTKLLPSSGGLPPHYQEAMKQVVAENPQLKDLPNWRLADLPETHRKIYGELIAQDVDEFKRQYPDKPVTAEQEREFFLRRSFMNSPTQCSTCHQ